MTDLVPCPLCGGGEGYEVTTDGINWMFRCRGCALEISPRYKSVHPDIGWNAAGAYAEGLRREVQRLRELCTSVHDRLLRGDSDLALLTMLEEAWKGGSDGR